METALIMLPLLILMFAAVDLGRYFITTQSLLMLVNGALYDLAVDGRAAEVALRVRRVESVRAALENREPPEEGYKGAYVAELASHIQACPACAA